MENTQKALKWIVNLFNEHDIPFQIAGGFAAIAYGARRELRDMDFYIPGKYFQKICKLVKKYIISGPQIYKDNEWDCEDVLLTHSGQNIDIANADNTKFFDKKENKWVKEDVDFLDHETIEIMETKVPVMPKQKLIEYKKRLGRDIDKIDLEQIIS